MAENNYNCTPLTPSSRLERHLREGKEKGGEQLFSDSYIDKNGKSEQLCNKEELSDTLRASTEEKPFKQRLLLVSNRLPVTAVKEGVDSYHLKSSVGGLVSALLGIKEFDTRWIGWPGVNVHDDAGQEALTESLAEMRCIPVFLDEEIINLYYNGYNNNILWPLCHYLGLPLEDKLGNTDSYQSQFDAYKKANQMFADVVIKYYEEGDIVWCHDLHLMLLPKILKEYKSNMKVGWFLHEPFPSSEVYRTLPSSSELLRAVLAADLVGFHTYDYARHFVSACTRILGLEGTPDGVEDQGKLTRVAVFPIGIDPDRFIRTLELPKVQDHMKELKERFGGRKVILGIDRLDMIKGIPQKILAFERFLEENPHWHDKVVLLQIAVPTRTDCPEYQKLTKQVHEIVGRVNGRFGTFTTLPIHYMDRSLDFNVVCALYAVADVALVTSLRDGMNLVSYEFVACQASKKGVLILSEFAGGAQSLGAGALLVNPWNMTQVVASIGYALNMRADEREKLHEFNFKHVTTHTSQEWAATFLRELNDIIVEDQFRTTQVPPLLTEDVVVDCYSKANNRLIILGFNTTLIEPTDALGRSGQNRELDLKLHPYLKESLKKLSNDPKTTLLVMSGSAREVLDKNFGEFNIWLAAENGMFLRQTSGEWMTTMPENITMNWVDSVKHVFEYFKERTPGSYFEVRETSLIWDYKYADVEFGRLQARDLLHYLRTGPISNASLDIIQGAQSVEVRSVGVSKGAAIVRILGEIVHHKAMEAPIDYVICIGNFLEKDEDVYKVFEQELLSESILLSLPKSSSSRRVFGSKAFGYKRRRSLSNIERREIEQASGDPWRPSDRISHESSSMLDLKGDNYFSCVVARKRSSAKYHLETSNDVVNLLSNMADLSSPLSERDHS